MSTIIIITPPVKPQSQESQEQLDRDIQNLRDAGYNVSTYTEQGHKDK